MLRTAVRAPGCTPPHRLNRRARADRKRTRHALIHADQAPGLIVGSAGSDDDRGGAGSGVNKFLLRASSGRRFPGPAGARRRRGSRRGVIKGRSPAEPTPKAFLTGSARPHSMGAEFLDEAGYKQTVFVMHGRFDEAWFRGSAILTGPSLAWCTLRENAIQ
jgi:hypothetical protein